MDHEHWSSMDVCVVSQFGLAQSIQSLGNEDFLNLFQCAELLGLRGIRHCSLGLSAVFHVPCGPSRSVTARAFRSRRGAWCTPYSQTETSRISYKRQIIFICYYLLSCINERIHFTQSLWKQLCMDMTVITQLYCQLYITCQLHLFININQFDALNFVISLFQTSTCFEHMYSSSGGQSCIIQSLVSSHL